MTLHPSPTIVERLTAVMDEVGAIGKDSTMTEGPSYSYRSVEDVVAKVQPAFVKHGVVALPEVIDCQVDAIQWGRNKNNAWHVVLSVRWTFHGAGGDSLVAVTCGEAIDYSDKAVNKAQTAAMKYALTQALAIPVKGSDPDEHYPVSDSSGRDDWDDSDLAALEERMDHFPPKLADEVMRRLSQRAGAAVAAFGELQPSWHDTIVRVLDKAEESIDDPKWQADE